MQPSAPTQYRSPLTILVIVGLLIVLGLWYSFANATTPVATPKPTTEAPSQIIGQQRHLTNPNGTSGVSVFPAKADLDAAVVSLATHDQTGVNLATRNAVLVPVGSVVRVLDTGYVENQLARQIRVESGPYSGQAGWVLANALAP